ncbi:Fic family protein [Kordia algicida OT-1]|uniref:Filamentation induced by cAMP protein Fic n=1 Tax=Kordia algicida OT-1 TaxID=391587 RepID=A9DRW2_9FLAO|nr:Fic family protein [Kordia algicida]EDP96851.1 filamentation induced by cAMP protein Fic [Kordia algicida OT-1]
MLSAYLQRFNTALESFREKFPVSDWTSSFKSSLINDYSFYSSKIEDEKLQYGDTIKFLNGELVRKSKMKSLLDVSNHKDILESMINRFETFELTETTIKEIHRNLMGSELAWEIDFNPHLVGEYRNIPTIGYREPFFANKEYAPHYNLDVIMSSYIDIFNAKFQNIDNTTNEHHLITVVSYFHNQFLNEIHPFADGNGRVCRIIIGTVLMKNNCPPIFKKITSDKDTFEYISKIVACENENSNIPLVEFLANGMSDYLEERIAN